MTDALNTKIAALQIWLNAKGVAPKLKADGLAGPATRDAIIATFRNKSAAAITGLEMRMFADRLKCSTRQIAAVAKVESAGGGWDDTGLLKCLYERHYMWRRIKLAVPVLSDPKPGGYSVDANRNGINDSWEKLADAAMRWGFDTAFECASFGKFQIMGAWWAKLGYPSVADFVWSMSRSEKGHYEALVRYVETFGLVPAIRAISADPKDCLAFARGYNGKGQKGYDKRIADAYRSIIA